MLIPLGILTAQVSLGDNFFFLTYGGASSDSGASGVGRNADREIYLFGTTASAGPGNNNALLSKKTSQGSDVWQRALGTSGVFATNLGGAVVDSTDSVYCTGQRGSSASPPLDALAFILKYNSSGTLQWQRLYGTEGSNGQRITSNGTDIYVAVLHPISGRGNDWVLLKYNSSGTLQWQRNYGSANNDSPLAVHSSAGDDIYLAGAADSRAVVTKWNSSGTLQWQRRLNTPDFSQFGGLSQDSSGNVYACGFTVTSGSFFGIVAKYNSSGTLQWQRSIGTSGKNTNLTSVTVDPDGDIIVAGNTTARVGSGDRLILKYDSSGTLQWQRIIGGPAADNSTAITVDSSGNPIAHGTTSSAGAGGNDLFVTYTPKDGSLTGTYVLNAVDLVYQASTLTGSTSTFTADTPSHTSATPALAETAGALSEVTPALTTHIVTL